MDLSDESRLSVEVGLSDESVLRVAALQSAVQAGEGSGCRHDILETAQSFYDWVSKRTGVHLAVTVGEVTKQEEKHPMQIHDDEQFTLSVTETDAKGFPVVEELTWTVDNEDSVTLQVSDDKQSAVVVAGNPGSAVITLTDGTLTVTEAVDVVAGDGALITLNEGTPEKQDLGTGAPTV
jgi:hypothetical protein